jgi:hypothetical protein
LSFLGEIGGIHEVLTILLGLFLARFQ